MEPEKRPPGVMLYFDKMRPIFALLSAAEGGELVRKILDYAEYGKEPVFAFEERLESLWPSIRKAIDQDAAAYQKKREQAKKAIQARWDRENGVKERKEDGPWAAAGPMAAEKPPREGGGKEVFPYEMHKGPLVLPGPGVCHAQSGAAGGVAGREAVEWLSLHTP